jgi:hypothetical protein
MDRLSHWVVAVFVYIGLVAGSVFWQMMQSEPNWPRCVERSWFQFVALFCLCLMLSIIAKAR